MSARDSPNLKDAISNCKPGRIDYGDSKTVISPMTDNRKWPTKPQIYVWNCDKWKWSCGVFQVMSIWM